MKINVNSVIYVSVKELERAEVRERGQRGKACKSAKLESKSELLGGGDEWGHCLLFRSWAG